jgi:hypothetical protein
MRLVWACFLVLLGLSPLPAQDSGQQQPPPQSARQALIEMFTGKGADDFAKHLPDDARRALIRKGDGPENSTVLKIAMIGREVAAQGGHIETFDTGPNILISEDSNSRQRIEVAVEHDSLRGEDDEIELSVRLYKDGELQQLPVVPRLIFTMTQEKEIWRLSELTVAAHVPLTDPDYLKTLRKEQNDSNEASARSRVMMMAQAQAQYAANHKDLGYACTLATLYPSSEGGNAGVYPQGFGSEEANGYRFNITGCNGTPASKYRLLAAPVDPESEMKAFCVDESETIRSISGDKKTGCFSHGDVEMQVPPGSPLQQIQ